MDTRQKMVGSFAVGSGITSFAFILMLKKQNDQIRKLNNGGQYMFAVIKKMIPHMPTDVLQQMKEEMDFEEIVEQLQKDDS